MDFRIVIRQIRKAYQTGNYTGWSVEDFVEVFRRFYRMYAAEIGRDHPRLTTETIARVMASLVEDDNGVRYSPEDYLTTDLLNAYFDTAFNSDFCIRHFVSGDIRLIKSYEAVI